MKITLPILLGAVYLPALVQGAAIATPQCSTAVQCEQLTLEFEEFTRGDYIDFDAFATCGISNIRVKNHDGSGSNRKIRVFDTEEAVGRWDVAGAEPNCNTANCPSTSDCAISTNDCGDPDLQAPFVDLISGETGLRPGKVIIYDEKMRNSDDYHGSHLYPPDDSAGGARFIISFSRTVTIHSIEFLDIEHHESRASDITLFYADGDERNSTEVLETGDGKMHTQPILHGQGIDKLNVRLGGSGAISAITYTYDDETCAPTTSPTVSPTAFPTAPPTVVLTPSPTPFGFLDGNRTGGGGGDPHFKPWDSPRFSFHGECDLVMVHSDMFHDNAGFDLHARTTIQDYFSYIETAALRIGEDVLEMHPTSFILNGEEHTELPLTFGSGDRTYKLDVEPLQEGRNPNFYNYYRLDLGEQTSLLFKFYKQFLTIDIEGHPNDLSDATGLLGSFHSGAWLSRKGDVIASPTEFGFDWQVSPEEPKLFTESRSPMLPFEQCRMPTAARPARRLRGADLALQEDAHEACSAVSGADFELCVGDVMATGDIGVADLW